jgi:porin
MAGFKTDQGLISLTKVAPVLTAVSDYKGDIWNRAALFGDPDGERTRLYESGVTLDAQLTQVYQGVTSGGSAKGHGHGEYYGLFEANMSLDTAKLGMWSGGLFLFTLQSSFGHALKDQPGNLSPVNQTALWPIPFEDSTELMEYFLVQALSPKTVAIVGRIDASKYMDQNSLASNPNNQFLNVSMNANPLFGAFLSNSTYAALFATKVNENLAISYGAWTPNTQPGDYRGNWSDIGVVFNPQFKYRAFNHPGAIQINLAYQTKNATDVGNPRLPLGLATGNLPTKTDNWLIEIAGEQFFWEPEGVSVPQAEGGWKEFFRVTSKDFAQAQPGFGMFYRFSYTPADRNPYNIYLSGGVGGRGVIPGRPHDRFGVGAYWLKESSDLDKQPGNLLGDEKGVEAFYNFAITPWLQLSADAQWISPGKQSSQDAWVLGTRLNMRF